MKEWNFLKKILRERMIRNSKNVVDERADLDGLKKHIKHHPHDKDLNFEQLCDLFGEILDADASITNGVCLAQRLRNELDVKILGRKTNSPLVVPQFFSFENIDSKGNSLNLGETVILEEEIKPFTESLVTEDIIVTAIHNHWLFEDPRLFYMHFESIEPPLQFARKVANALKIL